MESLNNNSIKPSKRFLIRGGIATSIIALILIVQTNWFLGLFNKKNSQNLAVSDATIGDIVGKDSNGNGIADWEERLWGLDPTVTTTDGVSNKVIIEGKRKNLQSPDSQNEPLNETDKLARDLFGFTNALSNEPSINKENLSALAAKLGQKGVQINTLPVYVLKDLKTSQTTVRNLTAYKKTLLEVLSKNKSTAPELDLLIQGIENGDYSNFDDFDRTISYYNSVAKSLIKITVPIGVAQYHLDIANGMAGIGNSFQKIKTLEDNGLSALVGLSEYRYFDNQITFSIEKLSAYMEQYGIIN